MVLCVVREGCGAESGCPAPYDCGNSVTVVGRGWVFGQSLCLALETQGSVLTLRHAQIICEVHTPAWVRSIGIQLEELYHLNIHTTESNSQIQCDPNHTDILLRSINYNAKIHMEIPETLNI